MRYAEKFDSSSGVEIFIGVIIPKQIIYIIDSSGD